MEIFVEDADFFKRLKIVLDTRFGANQADFARKTGLKSSTVGGYFGDKPPSKIPIVMIRKLVASCGVNANWLLTGEGEMLLDSPPATAEPKQPEKTTFERDLAALTVYLDSMDASNETRKDALFRLFDDLRRASNTNEYACAESPPNNGHTVQERHAPFNTPDHKNSMKE